MYSRGIRAATAVFYFSAISLFLLIAEYFATRYAEQRAKEVKIELSSRERIDPELITFWNKYEERLDHLRGAATAVQDPRESASNLLFTKLETSSPTKDLLLLQGDSWAEAARLNSRDIFTDFGKQHHIDVVLAGVASYAPSPMTLQLDILRQDFNLHPTIIIAIFDQTDIGDELYRYDSQTVSDEGKIISVSKPGKRTELRLLKVQRENNWLSDDFGVIKLFRNARYNIEDYLHRRGGFAVLGGDILSPVQDGLSEGTKQAIRSRISRYVDTVFSDPNARFLFIVTHPHKNHLLAKSNSKRYKSDIGDLVREAIAENQHRSKVQHIDFLTDNLLPAECKDIFDKNDDFSHLTTENYREYFFPTILERVENIGSLLDTTPIK